MKNILLICSFFSLSCGSLGQAAVVKFHSATSTSIRSKGNKASARFGAVPLNLKYFTRGGYNSFNWYFVKDKTTKIVELNANISNALVQYYYPELASNSSGIYNLLKTGSAFTGGPIIWSPYTALDDVFTNTAISSNFWTNLQTMLSESLSNLIYPILNDAYINGQGLVLRLGVEPSDGSIVNDQNTTIRSIAGAIKPSANAVYGNIDYPGSQLKIRISKIYSQFINDSTKLHNGLEFWDWLTAQNGEQYAPNLFPLGRNIIGKAVNGYRVGESGTSVPWFLDPTTDVQQEMKNAVISNMSKIAAMAKQQAFDDGFMLIFTRCLSKGISSVTLSVSKPLAVHTPSTYKGVDNDEICQWNAGEDKHYMSYIRLVAKFNNVDLLTLANEDTTNHFYNWLTNYQGQGWHYGTGIRYQFGKFAGDNGLDWLDNIINSPLKWAPQFNEFKSACNTALRYGRGLYINIYISADEAQTLWELDNTLFTYQYL